MADDQTTRAARHVYFLDSIVDVRVASEDGSDGIAVLEFHAPGGSAPPLHVHRNEDEIFYLMEGRFRFLVDGEESGHEAGEFLVAPKGVPHTYRVESSAGGRFLTITRQGDFERFVRAFSRPAEPDATLAPTAPPTPEEVQALTEAAAKYAIDIVGPPLTA